MIPFAFGSDQSDYHTKKRLEGTRKTVYKLMGSVYSRGQ